MEFGVGRSVWGMYKRTSNPYRANRKDLAILRGVDKKWGFLVYDVLEGLRVS